jgi:glutathione S-transferase
MGGCWPNGAELQHRFAALIDRGDGLGAAELHGAEADPQPGQEGGEVALRALEPVLRHRQTLMARNPLGSRFDQPLRAALTLMLQGIPVRPEAGSALGLRYLRDRISVPRDMPLLSGRALRQALERTAALDGPEQPDSLPLQHRFDQDPRPFLQG